MEIVKGGHVSSPRPLSVSFVIPVLNEERHVEAAIRSVLRQEGLDHREIILALGESTDSTDSVVKRLIGQYPEIVSIRNPTSTISAGMNLGARAATQPFLIRLDAHTVLPPRYAVHACGVLRRTGAVNVGGRMRAEGTNPFENAVAWIYNSPVGLGGAIYHVGGEPGPAESAYLGVFDREQFLAADGFDETLSRGEDWELNHRLRTRGGVVWFDPELEVVYRPRSTMRALVRQLHGSGRWRGHLMRRLLRETPFRYFVPATLMASLILAAVCGALIPMTSGNARLALEVLALAPPATYALWLAGVVVGARGISGSSRWWLSALLPTAHVSWGAGCLLGFVFGVRGRNAYSGR